LVPRLDGIQALCGPEGQRQTCDIAHQPNRRARNRDATDRSGLPPRPTDAPLWLQAPRQKSDRAATAFLPPCFPQETMIGSVLLDRALEPTKIEGIRWLAETLSCRH